jgi:hypothetical protein
VVEAVGVLREMVRHVGRRNSMNFNEMVIKNGSDSGAAVLVCVGGLTNVGCT